MAENENPSMIVKYWGVRGSIPAPMTQEELRKKQTILVQKAIEDCTYNPGLLLDDDKCLDVNKLHEWLLHQPRSLSGTYGGDTTCIEVQAKDSPLMIIDAGTAIRHLGNALMKRMFSPVKDGRRSHLNPLCNNDSTARDAHLFFSHFHWDHMQGFPFFVPAFIDGANKLSMHFYGRDDTQKMVSEVLAGQQQYPTFPVKLEETPCKKEYHPLQRICPTSQQVGAARVVYQELTHPDIVFAYRVDVEGKAFVFASDTEPHCISDPRLVALARDADIMYYDAQYLPEEYAGSPKDGSGNKIGWGHSTYEWAVKTALAAGVRTVVLGHHEPSRSDDGLDKILERAQSFKDEQLRLPENDGKSLEVVMAYQGLEQRL